MGQKDPWAKRGLSWGHIYSNSMLVIINYYTVYSFSVPPLFVIEFLHRVVDTFVDYFQGCPRVTFYINSMLVIN